MKLQAKETLVQVFSREICEIYKNTYFYRTPPLVAPVRWGFSQKYLTAERSIEQYPLRN